MTFSAALSVLIVFAAVAGATAQTASINGQVGDQHGVPLADVEIALSVDLDSPPVTRSHTGPDGRFAIDVQLPGSYVLIAAKDDFEPAVVHVQMQQGNVSTVVLRLSRVNPTGRCAATASAGERGEFRALTPLFRWLRLVEQHEPGTDDAAAGEIGRWSRDQLDMVIGLVRHLSKVHREGQELGARNPAEWMRRRAATGRWIDASGTVRLQGYCFPMTEIAKVFKGNVSIKRGAVLHADIAVLVGDVLKRRPLYVEDGRERGRSRGSAHWEVGRRLLDSVLPDPAEDPDVQLWYRAVSAYLLRENQLDEAPDHLARARQLFADDPVFLVDSALIHEKLASEAVQAAVEELRDRRVGVQVDSQRTELERAERFLRAALALDPHAANVRLRLGHTLSELGRHEQAADELRAALDRASDRRLRYLGELFLGREERALGRLTDARSRFESAARLFPRAQSPWLALAELARRDGDRSAAIDLTRRAMQGGGDETGADDPRWFYFAPHLEDADVLMGGLRAMARRAVP
jgi:tetratricopeptide (TPR) repeat protein